MNISSVIFNKNTNSRPSFEAKVKVADNVAELGCKAFEEIKKAIPKLKEFGDPTVQIYLHYSKNYKDTLVISCQKTFSSAPSKAIKEPEKLFGKLLYRVRNFFEGPPEINKVNDFEYIEKNHITAKSIINNVYCIYFGKKMQNAIEFRKIIDDIGSFDFKLRNYCINF